jgi:hypothetical protein
MKIHEEFIEYESLWNEPLKESYIKTFEGKDYDLTRKRELQELIDAIMQKELGLERPLEYTRRSVLNRLILQLRHEGADRSILDELEDMLI